MKRLIFLLLVFPSFCLAQDKNVISVTRVFPKTDRVAAFEKALAAHAQKFHKGTWAWKVFTIETGPDANGYNIVEGPMSWDDVDNRGDLGKEHMADWNMNVTPLLIDRGNVSYSVYRPDLSSVALTDYSDKIAVNHVFYKAGYFEEAENIIKNLKKVWDASGQTIAVYEASSSGEPQFIVVTRYKQGLKERTPGFRKPMKERYTQVNGQNSWEEYIKGIKEVTDRSWSELLFYHPELSSK